MKLITYSVIGMSHFSGLGIKIRLLPRELKMGRSFTPGPCGQGGRRMQTGTLCRQI